MPEQSIHKVQREFDAYRRRAREEIAEAHNRGRDTAILQLLDLVDDCDRALELMYSTPDHTRLLEGMQQLRDRTMRRFGDAGLVCFGKAGETFDHNLHNAIAAEAGPGREGRIIKVHQRGWRREDGTIVRPAMVTVRKGDGKEVFQLDSNPAVLRRSKVSDPVRDSVTDYQCPFYVVGCVGDCPNCLLQKEIEEQDQ